MSSTNSEERSGSPLSPKTIVALVLGGLLLVFVLINRDATEISFILFSANAPLWVALGLAGAVGFVAGFLISRKRYRG